MGVGNGDAQPSDPQRTLFVHGTADTTVPHAWAQSSCQAIVAQGASCDFRGIQGGGHYIVPGNEALIDSAMTTDIADWLAL